MRIAFFLVALAIWVDFPAHAAPVDGVEVPTYCDLAGHLTMENCSLVNMALAEEFLDAARLARSQGNTAETRRVDREIWRKCDGVRAKSEAQTGGGSLDDVVERECRADGYHAAALRILGRWGKRTVIPYQSVQVPTYCTHDRGNPFGCAYINRLIAIEFFRRASGARRTSGTAPSSDPVTLEMVEKSCSPESPAKTNAADESQELETLKCVRSRLHEGALGMIR